MNFTNACVNVTLTNESLQGGTPGSYSRKRRISGSQEGNNFWPSLTNGTDTTNT